MSTFWVNSPNVAADPLPNYELPLEPVRLKARVLEAANMGRWTRGA